MIIIGVFLTITTTLQCYMLDTRHAASSSIVMFFSGEKTSKSVSARGFMLCEPHAANTTDSIDQCITWVLTASAQPSTTIQSRCVFDVSPITNPQFFTEPNVCFSPL